MDNFLLKLNEAIQSTRDTFLMSISEALEILSSHNNIDFLLQIIPNCPPIYLDFLIVFIRIVIEKKPQLKQEFLNFEYIFQPLIELARKSFYDFPTNTYITSCFIDHFFDDPFFCQFFMQTPILEFPFNNISIIMSDAAHNVPQNERELFDSSLIAISLKIIGDFFNFQPNENGNNFNYNFPQIYDSVSTLLNFAKNPNTTINLAAAEGAIKALNSSPEIFADILFSEKDHFFNSYISIFEANDDDSPLEVVQIGILEIFKVIILKLSNPELNMKISSSILYSLNMPKKSAKFQQKSLELMCKLLENTSDQFVETVAHSTATKDALSIFNHGDSPYNVKLQAFYFISYLINYPIYPFFVLNLNMFESVQLFISSVSFDDALNFIKSMNNIINLFDQFHDESLLKQLIQIGFVDEINCIVNNVDAHDFDIIQSLINRIQTI